MAKRQLPSVDGIRQLMSYDPETGRLFWKERGPEWFVGTPQSPSKLAAWWNIRFAGKEAFTPTNSRGYHTAAIFSNMLLAHRVAWAIHYGAWPEAFLDHINGDRADNRIANLRQATAAENGRNRGPQKNSVTGIKGVGWCKKSQKWRARVIYQRKQHVVGYFDDISEAADAYAVAVKQYHGEFART